jgi:ATP-binding cassette, subfamily F, member 3
MVSFIDVSKHYGTQDVLGNITCEIHEGRKIGLIGANGAGKTTFVRLLTGEEEPSSGRVSLAAGVRIGCVPQHAEVEPGRTLVEYMTSEVSALREALGEQETRLAGTAPDGMETALQSYQRARDAFDAAGGDEAWRRAEKLLDGLGLGDRMDADVSVLSGGERNVLSLAKALMMRPTLLVLDEPGNHLDYIGLAWLEKFLQEYPGAVLVVSHNRYLLDRIADGIFEIEGGRLAAYEGNYSDYRLARLRKAVAQQAEYSANQKRLAQLEELVRKFAEIARRIPDPAWGRRLHARKTQLEREKSNAVEKPEISQRRISVRTDVEETKADIALQVNAYTRSVGERTLFRGADLLIRCGERAALVGPNGCGKTTFLRDVVERSSWDSPELRIGPSLTVGYCAQHQEVFSGEKTILEEFMSLGAFTRSQVFAALSRFLFSWEDLDKRVSGLSGGEKNRLQLARVIMMKANFLILDEPTNHMDIQSREAIEESLSSFPGTILVVSHDRYLLDKIATTVIQIVDGRFAASTGAFSEVWAGRNPLLARGDGRAITRRKRYADAGAKQTAPAGADHARELERRITELEAEKRGLEAGIEAAFSRRDHGKGRLLGTKLERASRLLAQLYGEWESLG